MSEFHNVPITVELIEQSIVLEEDHFPIEEEMPCATCAEVFEIRQQVVEVYAPESMWAGKHKAVWYVHVRCYQGEDFPR